MPARDELPSTLRRSPEGARRTWIRAHDSAVETYGDGERAHRVAFSALKRGEGVDESATKDHLYDVARRLDVFGRSRMTKGELLSAIRRANRAVTRRARS
ncbi:ChaB family protein [Streptomyces chumphonensis]|uniref:ChaB family protein n=1 Tax=Streptomyces chumphonensis TaxID=1214925 RepID=UPI003D7438BD